MRSMVNAALIDMLPMPQRLAAAYAPARSRQANLALLALDARLAAILRGRHEPIAAQLRLAWWRETLATPPGEWPRGEPVLDALRDWKDPSCLSALPDGWEALLGETLDRAAVAAHASGRAQAFECLARELGVGQSAEVGNAARLWAMADLAAHLRDARERKLAVEMGLALPRPARLPRALRPLTVLAALGRAALERGGGPLLAGRGSAFLALRAGVAGR